MRIGVDACCWSNGRGYGRFTRELLRNLVALAPDDQFVFFADPSTAAKFELEAPNVNIVAVAQDAAPARAAAADGYRSPADMLRLMRAVWNEPLEVFFSPSVYTYFPLPPRLPAVVTIHDTIAERHPELTLPSRRARLFWNGKVRLALWQARLVLTVSDFSARELTDVLRVRPARIRVAVEAPSTVYRPSESAADVAAAAERIGIPPGAEWFTYVGGFNPHKHVDVMVRAHAAIAREAGESPPHLVLVGTTGNDVFHKELGHILDTIAETGTEHLVHWAGFVPDEELRHLHSGAVALLLPSEREGFGLPAVEAAACGTPVIATTASPLPELLAGGGIFVPPRDEATLAAALRTLLYDLPLRRTMGETARHRAAQLCWTHTARAALDTLHEAAA